MKHFPALAIALALVPPLVTGCGKPAAPGDGKAPTANAVSAPPAPAPAYKIASRRATAKNYVVEVQVTPGSANAALAQWSGEIVKASKGKKNLQVNFYDGKPGKDTLIARFENGKLFDPLRPGRILTPKK